MIALILFASSFTHALPQTLEDRIRSNNYRCSESEIVLKGFWGDWLGQSFAMKAREYAPSESCANAIQGLYGQGSIELFDLFDQVKSFKDPQMLAPLIGHTTTFDSSRKDMVIARLKSFGVKFDDPDNRWAVLMARFTTAKRDGFRRSDEGKLLTEARALLQATSFSREAFNREYYFLPRTRLGESIFKLDLDLRAYRQGILSAGVMKQIAEKFLASVDLPQYIKDSRYTNYTALHPVAYLIQNERQNLISDRDLVATSLLHNTLTALASGNEEVLRRILTLDQVRGLETALYQSNFPQQSQICPTVLGVATKLNPNSEFRRLVIQLYKKLSCHNLEYYFAGLIITDENQLLIRMTPRKDLSADVSDEGSALLAELKQAGVMIAEESLSYRNESLVLNCAKTSLIAPFVTGKNAMPLLAKALEVKCEPLVNLFIETAKNHNASAEVAAYLKTTPKTQLTQLAAKRVEVLMSVAGPKLTMEKTAELKDFFAPPEPKPSQFSWRGSEFYLVTDKLSRAQIQFLKNLRKASSEKQIIMALRDGLLAKQLDVRKLDHEDLAEVEKSLNGFQVSGLKAGLRDSKALLDRALGAGDQPSFYNEKFTSVFDIFRSRRAQCVSGTEFMLLHLSMLENFTADGQTTVTVHRPRHVLPATFDLRKKQMELVESTAAGEARGLMRLRNHQLPQDTQVILADDYLVFQILSDVLRSPVEARDFALNRAATVLKIKQGAITPAKPQTGSGDALNQTIFSFGETEIPQGDVTRTKIDQLPGGFNPAQMGQGSGVSANAAAANGYTGAADNRMRQEYQYGPDAHLGLSKIPDQRAEPILHLIRVAQTEALYISQNGPKGMLKLPHPRFIQIVIEKAIDAMDPETSRWLYHRIVESHRALFSASVAPLGAGNYTTIEMGLESPSQRQGVSKSDRAKYFELKAAKLTPWVLSKSKVPPDAGARVLHFGLHDAILILKMNNKRSEGTGIEADHDADVDGLSFELSVVKYEYLQVRPDWEPYDSEPNDGKRGR